MATTDLLILDTLLQKHGDKYRISYDEKNFYFTCKIHKFITTIPKPDIDLNREIFCSVCADKLIKEADPDMFVSQAEEIIRNYFRKNNITYEWQKEFENCRYKDPLPFDFYLPQYNILIEYDGDQHFMEVAYWDGKQGLIDRRRNDKIKSDFCYNNNITLLRLNSTHKDGNTIIQNIENQINTVRDFTILLEKIKFDED